MGYFNTYQRKAIQAGIVDQEGDYQVKITEVTPGTINDPRNGDKQYVQVKCLVNHKALPTISIFLTEGESFDGNFTAFCDTFAFLATSFTNSSLFITNLLFSRFCENRSAIRINQRIE